MEFELKELILVVTVLAAVIGAFEVMRYRVKKAEDHSTLVFNAVFQEKGGLNLVDNATCKDRRTQIRADISVVERDVKRQADTILRAFDEIHCINQNLIELMIHSGVKHVEPKKKRGQ